MPTDLAKQFQSVNCCLCPANESSSGTISALAVTSGDKIVAQATSAVALAALNSSYAWHEQRVVIHGFQKDVIMNRDQFGLTDAQVSKIEPHLPADRRSKAHVDVRRRISGIVHVLNSGHGRFDR